MEPSETVIWEITFASPITFNNTLDTKHYYSAQHLSPVTANKVSSFNFNGVTVAGVSQL